MSLPPDGIFDIGRLENVHFNPWWSVKPKLLQWQIENGEAFIFGRSDWEYVLNTFCFGYRVGYKFMRSEAGVCNGNFLGLGADACCTAVLVEQSAPYGLLITNGQFVAFHGIDQGLECCRLHAVIAAADQDPVASRGNREDGG